MNNVSSLLNQLLSGGGADMLGKAKQSWDSQSTGTKGALAGGLLGVLLGGRGGLAGMARVGGAALIGSIASQALANYQAGKSPMDAVSAALGMDTASAPPVTDELSGRLVRAMISAAKADGNVSTEEQARIKQQIETLGLGPEVAQLIQDELAQPLDLDRVAAMAKTPDEAAQLYTVSMLAVDPNGATERDYLNQLAGKLSLPPDLVAHLQAQTRALTQPA